MVPVQNDFLAPSFEVIAHRGVPDKAPENSLEAFDRAFQLGAYGIEFDVRLSSDGEPLVFHDFELDGQTTSTGPLVSHTAEAIRAVALVSNDERRHSIPPLKDVLELAAGRGLIEIELKGLEPEIVDVVAATLMPFRHHWASMEVTSYEPALLRAMREKCTIPVDVLMPRSEPWMNGSYIAYSAVNRARVARARGVHLHPSQLSREVVDEIRTAGIEIHCWDVNSREDVSATLAFGITRFDTDRLSDVFGWLEDLTNEAAL